MNTDKKDNRIVLLFSAFQVFVAAVFLYVVFVIIKDNICACMERFPREYREAANMVIARSFLDGHNPYSIPTDGRAYSICVYGFINPLLAAGITKVTGIGLLNSFYILYMISTFIFCGLVIFEVYSILVDCRILSKTIAPLKRLVPCKEDKWENVWQRNVFLLFISLFIMSYTLTYRMGHISTIPDPLGMAVGALILIIARRSKGTPSVVLVTFLIIIEFYIKAYYLFFAAPVFIFYLMEDMKLLVKYVISGIVIGIISIVIVSAVFPLYFIDTFYFEFLEQFMNEYSAEGILDMEAYKRQHMISQFVKLISKYNFILIIAIIVIFYSIIYFIRKDKSGDNLVISNILIYIITACIAIPLLFLLGKNDGAYMSYHFQLLMPSVIIIAYTLLIGVTVKNNNNCYDGLLKSDGRISKNMNKMIGIIVLLMVVFSTYKSYVAFGRVSLLSNDEKKAWGIVEEICTKSFDEGNRDFYGVLVGGLMMDRRSYYSDYNGHQYLVDVTEYEVDAVSENEVVSSIFQMLPDMYGYAAECNQDTERMFEKGIYNIIAVDDEKIARRIYPEYYSSETIKLRMGQEECSIALYRSKGEQ